jgi:pyruvate formate lyase activating enzyme
LDTNGSHPSLLKQLLKDKLLDYVAMDIKAPWAKYPMLTGGFTGIEDIQCSLNLIVQSGVASEFRTTVVPGLLTPEDVEQIRREMPVGAVHKTQDFIADYALDPALRK